MPIVSGGKGGGAPTGAAGGDLGGTYPNPTVDLMSGGTVTGALALEPSSTSAIPLAITAPVGTSALALAVIDPNDHAKRTFSINEVGELNLRTTNEDAKITTNDNGTVTVTAGSAGVGRCSIIVSSFDNIYNTLADNAEFQVLTNVAAPLFRVLEANGVVIFKANAAPDDGSLSAGECAIWFDSTNAAAAFNIKAKQADGAVKTATIPVVT